MIKKKQTTKESAHRSVRSKQHHVGQYVWTALKVIADC